ATSAYNGVVAELNSVVGEEPEMEDLVIEYAGDEIRRTRRTSIDQ
ncbi:hypothetical protein A2U01_0077962, partial [Trifolium medium]|nr:hypothetical protein [Trifolium medium]